MPEWFHSLSVFPSLNFRCLKSSVSTVGLSSMSCFVTISDMFLCSACLWKFIPVSDLDAGHPQNSTVPSIIAICIFCVSQFLSCFSHSTAFANPDRMILPHSPSTIRLSPPSVYPIPPKPTSHQPQFSPDPPQQSVSLTFPTNQPSTLASSANQRCGSCP